MCDGTERVVIDVVVPGGSGARSRPDLQYFSGREPRNAYVVGAQVTAGAAPCPLLYEPPGKGSVVFPHVQQILTAEVSNFADFAGLDHVARQP